MARASLTLVCSLLLPLCQSLLAVQDPVSAVEEQEPVKESLEEFHKKQQDFKNVLKVWKGEVGKNWKSEVTDPVTARMRQKLQPAVEAVDSLVSHTRRFNEGVRALKKELNKTSVRHDLKEIWEYNLKTKLNASTGKEAIANLLAKASERRNASNASPTVDVVALQGRRGRTGLKARNLTELLKINTSDPAWKLATKTVKVTKKLASAINASAHTEGDAGAKVANLLQKIPIPAETGTAIGMHMLPFVVGNAALKDVPMTSTERAAINLGIFYGTFGHAVKESTMEEKYNEYEKGLKAIDTLKANMGIKPTEPLL